MSVHLASPLTEAVVALLVDAGITAGNGEKPGPDDAGAITAGWTGAPGQSPFLPYAVVYSMLGGTTDGSMDDPDADAFPVYQVTSVGGNAQQAEWLGDIVRAAVTAFHPTIGARRVVRVRIDVLGGVVRDDEGDPPLWYVPERYRFITTPT